MKVALVHDVLINSGGAERVAAVFAEIFPDAPVFTGAYHPEKTFSIFGRREIFTTFLQRLPHNERLVKLLFPLAIPHVEAFDFRGFDLVLSSSTFLAKGIITPPETCHVCYMHNIFRLLWLRGAYETGGGKHSVRRHGFLAPLRLWDVAASRRPDFLITNSRVTRQRIRKFYRREPEVLHPPVDTSLFQISPFQDDFFLVVSRLEPYKRVDIAIGAFNRLGHRLVVVGEGSMRTELEKQANRNIEFLGLVTDELLTELYGKCHALIFPQEEDFGLVPLEAQASGRPVIAYGAGGVLETVTEDTGVFFPSQTKDALIEAVVEFRKRFFDPEKIRGHALQFDKKRFREKLLLSLERHFAAFTGKDAVPPEVLTPS